MFERYTEKARRVIFFATLKTLIETAGYNLKADEPLEGYDRLN